MLVEEEPFRLRSRWVGLLVEKFDEGFVYRGRRFDNGSIRIRRDS